MTQDVNPAVGAAAIGSGMSPCALGALPASRQPVRSAVPAAEEAVAERRRLAAVDPAAHTPELALSLNALSIRLAEVGRIDEGRAVIEEAVRLSRQLAAADPASGEAALARASTPCPTVWPTPGGMAKP